MKERKMKVNGVMALSQAVACLEDVLSSLKAGILLLETGQETLQLMPPAVVDFELEMAQKKDKEKLQLELSWKTGAKAKAAPVTIGSK